MGRSVGFSVADIDQMTPAMIFDAAIYELNTQTGTAKQSGQPNAVQTDYDNF